MDMVKAEVNHGRWVAECPECHWAIKVKDFGRAPEFERFGCAHCGQWLPSSAMITLDQLAGQLRADASYVAIRNFGLPIEYPAQLDAIETALRKRKLSNRNWAVGETIEFLEAENKEYGR